jgi:hypothetical protein
MRWLDTVSFKDLKPQMVLAALRVDEVCKAMGVDCWITSGNDLTHSTNSLHYSGNAFDFRTRDLPLELRPSFASKVKAALGREFDVVLERDHLHVEYEGPR